MIRVTIHQGEQELEGETESVSRVLSQYRVVSSDDNIVDSLNERG